MAIDGGFAWTPSTTHLQLMCESIVMDGYAMEADSIRWVHREVKGDPLPDLALSCEVPLYHGNLPLV